MIKRVEWIDALERCLTGFTRDFPEDKETKEEYTEKVMNITSSAATLARKAAGCINNNVNIILSVLDKIENPTKEEVRCLSESLGGQFYYVDRKLASIAEKAGMQASYRPAVDEALKYIKQIEGKAIDFIKGYTGQEDLSNVMAEVKTIAKKL